MQNTSALYQQIYTSQDYQVETTLAIGGAGHLITEDGDTITFGGFAIKLSSSDSAESNGYGDDILISVKTLRQVFPDNVPVVGGCTCGEIDVEMIMPKGTIPRQAELKPFTRLLSNVDGSHSEWLPKGTFYIDTRDNTRNDDDLDILRIHGYDAMLKTEQDYGEFFTEIEFTISEWTKSNGTYTATLMDGRITNQKSISVEYIGDDNITFGSNVTVTQISGGARFTTRVSPPPNLYGKIILRDVNTLGFPATDLNVVYDIAAKIGVSVDPRTIPFINKAYTIQYPSQYTMREVLGYIGGMYAGNWIINDLGKLQLIPLYDLPAETSLLTDEMGYRLVFGGDRILVEGA